MRMIRSRTCCALALGCGVLAASGAVTPAAAEGREFSVTPYLWMASLEGDVAPLPNLPTVHVDSSFDDIVDTLQFAFAAAGEARRGRWAVIGDFSYVDTGLSKHSRSSDPTFLAIGLNTKTVTASAAVAYRVVEGPSATVDLFGGGRLSWVENDISLTGPAGGQVGGEHDETWVDPFIGGRADMAVTPRWTLSAYADIGGFGVASDLTYQLYVGAGYHINDHLAVVGGYRYYSVDYAKGGFKNDVVQHGPIVGLQTRF